MMENITDFFWCKTEIDWGEKPSCLGGGKIGFHEMIRIEEENRNPVSFSQPESEKALSELIGPGVQFLIGEPSFLIKDRQSRRKLLGSKG